MGTSVWHDSDQQIERALVRITPKCGMARCGCGVTESASVRMPSGRWIQCRLKTEDRSTPSAQRLLLSLFLFSLCLVVVSNSGTRRSARSVMSTA